MPLLSIDIEARFAKFQDALTAIERNTQKSADKMTRAFSNVKGAMAGLGVGISVAGLVAVTKNAIDAADHLNDLSQETGIAVSTLGGLGFAAGKAGGDLESIASAAGKLNKSIAEAAGGSKTMTEAFSAIGVSVLDAEGNVRKADAVMADIATRFQGFEDGPQKAALAMRLFGKSGADIIPLLNEGGESLRQNIELYKQYGGVTDEVAKRSDQFNDTMANIGLMTGAFGRTLASELLPSLQNLASYMLDAKNQSNGFETAAKGLATVLKGLIGAAASVGYAFKGIGTNIGGTLAMLDRIAVWDFKGAGQIRKQLQKDLDGSRQDFEKFMTNLQNGTTPAGPAAPKPGKGKGKPAAPTLKTGGGTATADDPSRRILEGQLKAIERLSDEERTLLSTRQEFMQAYYQQDLISIADYFDARRAAQEEALRAQLANLDKEISLLEGSKPKDARGAAERDNKVAELQDKKAALQKAAGLEGQRAFIEQEKAARDFENALKDINATLLEQQGYLTEAATIRFDQQYGALTSRLQAERQSAVEKGDTKTAAARDADIAKIGVLRSLAVSRAQINGLESVGAQIQSDLAMVTERAVLAQQTGAATELESLRMVSDARLQSAADLQQVADAFAAVAHASNDPSMIRQAQALQLEVEKLAASADLVRDKFADVFSSGFESALEKLMSGTASIKDVFKDLASDIVGQFNRIIAENISDQLFSKQGALGGVADFFSGVFGGQPQVPAPMSDVTGSIAKATDGAVDTASIAATSAAMTTLASTATAADASLLTLSSTVPLADSALATISGTAFSAEGAMITLTTAAHSAAAALSSVAASGGGEAAGDILGSLFSAASGGGGTIPNDLFATGAAFERGNVIPFKNGGIPSSIVSTPTFFPMAGGKTGLMGEAGPEAIMPLKRDERGDLAVTVVGDRGKVSLLPVTRDAQGRLAVRAAEAFAKGAAFNGGRVQRFATGGIVERSASTFTEQMRVVVPQSEKGGDVYHINVPYTAQPGVSRTAAQQQGVEFGRGIERSLRRNG